MVGCCHVCILDLRPVELFLLPCSEGSCCHVCVLAQTLSYLSCFCFIVLKASLLNAEPLWWCWLLSCLCFGSNSLLVELFLLHYSQGKLIVGRLSVVVLAAVTSVFHCPGANQRMWALHKLRKLMSAYCGPLINVNALLSSPTSESPEPEVPRPFHMVSDCTAAAAQILLDAFHVR